MRVFVVETLGTGGMIHFAYQLCTAMANQGADVTLVTDHDYELEERPHNFTVEKRLRLWKIFDPNSSRPPRSRLAASWRKVCWAFRRFFRAAQLIREWIFLTIYLLRQKPDLIQFGRMSSPPLEVFFLILLRWRGLILTQICHEFELREYSGGLLVKLSNRLIVTVFRNFSAIFLLGESTRKRFLTLHNVPREWVHVVPHGNLDLFLSAVNNPEREVELRQRYSLNRKDPVVLFFGILAPSKGLPDLLRSFALVNEQYSSAKLLVVGFPSKLVSMKELKSLVTDLGVSDAVVFDPRYIPSEEIEAIMKLARVVVYPYRSSSQSGALQLAYTFSRPVIVTTVGGLPESVEDGRSGILVPPESPKELAAAILKIVSNPELAEKMGNYARHLSETRYSWTPIAGKILAVYNDLLTKTTNSCNSKSVDKISTSS